MFNLHLKGWLMENNMVRKIDLKCQLLIFACCNSKFKATCKNRDFEWWYIRTPSEENPQIFNITFAHFVFFSSKYFNCHPEYFGVYFSWWNHHMHFKMVHSNTKKAKSRVYQSQVCYLHTTHSSVLNLITCIFVLKMFSIVTYFVGIW